MAAYCTKFEPKKGVVSEAAQAAFQAGPSHSTVGAGKVLRRRDFVASLFLFRNSHSETTFGQIVLFSTKDVATFDPIHKSIIFLICNLKQKINILLFKAENVFHIFQVVLQKISSDKSVHRGLFSEINK